MHAIRAVAGHFVFYRTFVLCCKNCLSVLMNPTQGDGGSHRDADGKRLPSHREGWHPSDQAVHAQGRRGAHQREETPAAAWSEVFIRF